jgi:hypothetical protein
MLLMFNIKSVFFIHLIPRNGFAPLLAFSTERFKQHWKHERGKHRLGVNATKLFRQTLYKVQEFLYIYAGSGVFVVDKDGMS